MRHSLARVDLGWVAWPTVFFFNRLSEISYETHSATEAREGVGAIDLPGLVSWHRNIIPVSISVTSIIYYR